MSAFAERLSTGPEQLKKKYIYQSIDLDREVFIGLNVNIEQHPKH